jgi:hypothetical protein
VQRRRAILAFVQIALPSDPADWPPDTGKLLADKSKSPSRRYLPATLLARADEVIE